jgi:hypothetical protein
MDIQSIWLIVLSVGLIAVSAVLFFLFTFFRRLAKGVNEKDLRKLLDKILLNAKDNTKSIEDILREIDRIKDEDRKHVQKIGIVRFNPFDEIGGDHSFSLAILDGRDNGFVITTLHTRERTRVYAKELKVGKSELELSEEERKAIIKARKI